VAEAQKRMKKRWMAKVGSRERIAKETERMREGCGATETRGRERKKGKGRKRKREANS